MKDDKAKEEREKDAEQRRRLIESRLDEYPHSAMVEVEPDSKTLARWGEGEKDLTLARWMPKKEGTN